MALHKLPQGRNVHGQMLSHGASLFCTEVIRSEGGPIAADGLADDKKFPVYARRVVHGVKENGSCVRIQVSKLLNPHHFNVSARLGTTKALFRYTGNVSQRTRAMGVILRATTLIVATALVTLSSAANAHYRDGAPRYIRWCTGPSPAFGLPYFFPCGRHRYHYGDGYSRYYSGR